MASNNTSRVTEGNEDENRAREAHGEEGALEARAERDARETHDDGNEPEVSGLNSAQEEHTESSGVNDAPEAHQEGNSLSSAQEPHKEGNSVNDAPEAHQEGNSMSRAEEAHEEGSSMNDAPETHVNNAVELHDVKHDDSSAIGAYDDPHNQCTYQLVHNEGSNAHETHAKSDVEEHRDAAHYHANNQGRAQLPQGKKNDENRAQEVCNESSDNFRTLHARDMNSVLGTHEDSKAQVEHYEYSSRAQETYNKDSDLDAQVENRSGAQEVSNEDSDVDADGKDRSRADESQDGCSVVETDDEDKGSSTQEAHNKNSGMDSHGEDRIRAQESQDGSSAIETDDENKSNSAIETDDEDKGSSTQEARNENSDVDSHEEERSSAQESQDGSSAMETDEIGALMKASDTKRAMEDFYKKGSTQEGHRVGGAQSTQDEFNDVNRAQVAHIETGARKVIGVKRAMVPHNQNALDESSSMTLNDVSRPKVMKEHDQRGAEEIQVEGNYVNRAEDEAQGKGNDLNRAQDEAQDEGNNLNRPQDEEPSESSNDGSDLDASDVSSFLEAHEVSLRREAIRTFVIEDETQGVKITTSKLRKALKKELKKVNVKLSLGQVEEGMRAVFNISKDDTRVSPDDGFSPKDSSREHRLIFQGFRLKTDEELARGVNICLIVASDSEYYQGVKNLGVERKDLENKPYDLKRLQLFKCHHSPFKFILVGQLIFKKSEHARGALPHILQRFSNIGLVIKTGSVGSEHKVGTMIIMAEGRNKLGMEPRRIVLYDIRNPTKPNFVCAEAGIPSTTVASFGYEYRTREANVNVVHEPIACVDEEIFHVSQAPSAVDWEIAGVIRGCQVDPFFPQKSVSLVSVCTDQLKGAELDKSPMKQNECWDIYIRFMIALLEELA